nr:hypothetical protein [Tanacetum cinerariifolium]
MVERNDEIKVLGEINSELESGTNKLIGKLSQEKDNDDASISGKSCEHFDWDWPEKDSPSTEFDWQDDLFHETKDLFVGLDQAIQVVVVQNNVQQEVAEEVVFYLPVHEEVVEEVMKWLMIKLKNYLIKKWLMIIWMMNMLKK